MGKIIIDQIFVDEKFNKSTLRKEYDTDLVPVIGMEMEESVWEKPKKIKKINLNIGSNSYIVFIDDEFVTKKTIGKITDNYKTKGWKEI